MQKNRFKGIIFAAVTVFVLVGLAWYASLRIDTLRGTATSLDLLLGDIGSVSEGRVIDDMGALVKGDDESLPVLWGEMPQIEGIAEWLNGNGIDMADLEGKVVLFDFWTYSCINCIRTLPYLTAWHERYRDDGLVIIGIHTPEFAFEKKVSNVQKALDRHGIEYPVALDNDFTTWNNFNNRYWPAKYLFDAKGQMRYAHFGEGEYDKTERSIQTLLKEVGIDAVKDPLAFASDVDFRKIGSPETYIGYWRLSELGSPEPIRRDQVQTYSRADNPKLNKFYLDGEWNIEREFASLVSDGGAITFRYNASDVNLVMGLPDGNVRVEVLLDGGPVPPGFRGDDIVIEDGKTWLNVGEEKLYSIIKTIGEYSEHVLDLEFQDGGVEAYAFTFG